MNDVNIKVRLCLKFSDKRGPSVANEQIFFNQGSGCSTVAERSFCCQEVMEVSPSARLSSQSLSLSSVSLNRSSPRRSNISVFDSIT